MLNQIVSAIEARAALAVESIRRKTAELVALQEGVTAALASARERVSAARQEAETQIVAAAVSAAAALESFSAACADDARATELLAADQSSGVVAYATTTLTPSPAVPYTPEAATTVKPVKAKASKARPAKAKADTVTAVKANGPVRRGKGPIIIDGIDCTAAIREMERARGGFATPNSWLANPAYARKDKRASEQLGAAMDSAAKHGEPVTVRCEDGGTVVVRGTLAEARS